MLLETKEVNLLLHCNQNKELNNKIRVTIVGGTVALAAGAFVSYVAVPAAVASISAWSGLAAGKKLLSVVSVCALGASAQHLISDKHELFSQ